MVPVDIGNGFEGNAFGTLLFTLYRDLNLLGIFVGGVVYAIYFCKSYLDSVNSWRARALFILLAYGLFTGMMVSPVEQGFFWFAIIFISFISKISVFGTDSNLK
jgi:hypothetical protein